MENTIVLAEGTLVGANETDRFLVNMMKGLGVNLVVLP